VDVKHHSNDLIPFYRAAFETNPSAGNELPRVPVIHAHHFDMGICRVFCIDAFRVWSLCIFLSHMKVYTLLQEFKEIGRAIVLIFNVRVGVGRSLGYFLLKIKIGMRVIFSSVLIRIVSLKLILM